MSPEQARGDRVDHRSDVFSFGIVLHEMLAGEPPFTGPTAQAIVAKVLTAEPAEVTWLRKTIPPQVADAVSELSREAGLRRTPEVFWNPMRSAGGAIAFGTPWRPCVGLSAGTFDDGPGEKDDFEAALRFADERFPELPIWAAGMSFGSWVALTVKRVTTFSPAATWSSMTKRTLEKAAEYSATRRL